MTAAKAMYRRGFRQATTHWLRHTAITHQADRAIELRFLNKSARHAKLETTGLYLHADDADWSKAMERHRLSDTQESDYE